jgi:hypothetical protein
MVRLMTPGEGSPGEQRAQPHRQRRDGATDSRVEQGLEVGSDARLATARGQGPAATRGKATREGKALEGVAP